MIKSPALCLLCFLLCQVPLLSPAQLMAPCAVNNSGTFWITGVRVGSINNSTAYIGGSGRADYTAMTTDMTAGTAYSITVTVNMGGWDNQCGLGIWADWNQNGAFETNEAISLQSNGAPAASSYTASITPPKSAYNGQVLLRVRFLFSRDLGILPCGENDVIGETEDYVIRLTGASNPPAYHNTCINADVEDGTFNGWTGTTGGNNDSGKPMEASTLEPLKGGIFSQGLNAGADDTLARHTIVSAAGTDPYGVPMVAPGGGTFSIRLGGRYVNPSVTPCNYYQCDPRWRAQMLRKAFVVDPARPIFSYQYVAVLQDAGTNHTPQEQPYFRAGIYDQSGKLIPCTDYYVFAASKITNFHQVGETNGTVVNANNWTRVTVDLTPYAGQLVTAQFTSACCTRGSHFGYAYIDASCTTAPVPGKDTICEGSSITLTAPAGGLSYLWTPGNQTTQSITVSQPGKYMVSITNAGNCVSTLTKEVYVTSMQLNLAAVHISCGNKTGSATASVTGNTGPYIVTGKTPFTYQWSPSGATTAQVSGLTAGTYTCTVTDADGCRTTAAITITQAPELAATTTSQPATCGAHNGSASVNVSGGTLPYTYTWTPSGGTSSTASGLAGGSYTCTITDSKGCVHTVSVVVAGQSNLQAALLSSKDVTCHGAGNGTAAVTVSGGTAPYTYSWTPAGGTTATASGLAPGSYTCHVTDIKGCKTAVPVTISEPPPLNIRKQTTDVTCFSGNNGSASLSVSGGTPGYSYSWSLPGNTGSSVSGLYAGSYTCTVTDTRGCSQSVEVSITEPAALNVKTSGSAVSCSGQNNGSVSVSASGGSPAYTYSWSAPGSTAASMSNLGAGSYTCTVTDSRGCTLSGVATVNEGQKLAVHFEPDTASCAPLRLSFRNLSQPNASGNTCFWRFGDGTTSKDCNPAHTYSLPGTYSVTLIVTTGNGCTDSLTRKDIIEVYPRPRADFSISPQPTSIFNPGIFFRDLSSGNPVSWQWTFWDHAKDAVAGSSEQHPSYTYSDTGKYRVKLLVVNQHGCRDSIFKYVHIGPEWSFYIPNTFTPNGDGKNEGFIGRSWNVTEHQMWIFDRWGNMIYTTGQTKDPESALPWDGRASGGAEIAQIDTYVWLVVLKDIFGKRHRYVGHVNLIK